MAVYRYPKSFRLSLVATLRSVGFLSAYREYNTPTKLADEAIRLEKKYSHKRFIVHFLPPHTPYVGQTSNEYLPPYEEQHGILAEIHQNDYSAEIIRKAYRENLERMLPEVERLLASFTGKTVVTADHGELLGERVRPLPIREWGHYKNMYVPELITVPWLVVNDVNRKEVLVEQSNVNRDDLQSTSVNERLE